MNLFSNRPHPQHKMECFVQWLTRNILVAPQKKEKQNQKLNVLIFWAIYLVEQRIVMVCQNYWDFIDNIWIILTSMLLFLLVCHSFIPIRVDRAGLFYAFSYKHIKWTQAFMDWLLRVSIHNCWIIWSLLKPEVGFQFFTFLLMISYFRINYLTLSFMNLWLRVFLMKQEVIVYLWRSIAINQEGTTSEHTLVRGEWSKHKNCNWCAHIEKKKSATLFKCSHCDLPFHKKCFPKHLHSRTHPF